MYRMKRRNCTPTMNDPQTLNAIVTYLYNTIIRQVHTSIKPTNLLHENNQSPFIV